MARRSGRMSLALLRRARPIACCSECWSGVGWKSNEFESRQEVEGGSGLDRFFFFFPSGYAFTMNVLNIFRSYMFIYLVG
jgi:hypothetical protein